MQKVVVAELHLETKLLTVPAGRADVVMDVRVGSELKSREHQIVRYKVGLSINKERET